MLSNIYVGSDNDKYITKVSETLCKDVRNLEDTWLRSQWNALHMLDTCQEYVRDLLETCLKNDREFFHS